ncbi:hypothetical protein KC219_22960, partial [Mycobacterium tuberculosis]|nr:hypothetical protein [Mycobacterium tuberculosis]
MNTEKSKKVSPARKMMKFGEQGDTIILRITAKNRIKIRSVARDMDLCLLNAPPFRAGLSRLASSRPVGGR